MKKNGFTLVELLAVIVLLALLMVIAVPNAFRLASKVKGSAYTTKIDLIEKAGQEFGQTNIKLVREGTSITNSSEHHTCTFNYDNKKDITSVSYNAKAYSASTSLIDTGNKKEFWCTRVSVADLVNAGNLDWDYSNQCNGNCSSEQERKDYDSIVEHPSTKYIMNRCNVYVYYRNSRVYTYFDKEACDVRVDVPNSNGNSYRKKMS